MEYQTRTKHYRYLGNELLRFRASFPLFDGENAISSFYESLSKEAQHYCEETWFPSLQEQLKGASSPRERCIFPHYYFSIFSFVSTIENNFIIIDTTIQKKENNVEIYRLILSHRWSMETQQLLPPVRKLKKARHDP